MIDPIVLVAALLMGLFATPHCLFMCGGLVSAFTLGQRQKTLVQRLSYVFKLNIGRIASYSVLGIIFGSLGAVSQQYLPASQLVFRLLAGLLLILCGLYIAGWWTGLRYVETLIGAIGQRISKALGSQDKNPASQRRLKVWLTGISWGCLPCGLVYSALSLAMTQSSALGGGIFMLCFGLGTMPLLLTAGLLASALTDGLKNDWVKGTCGSLMIGYGSWTIAAPWLAANTG